jgi:CHASE3 domain sensor protein
VCKQASALIKQQRIHLSTEWINCTIKSTSDDREKQLSAIRGKLKKHLESEAHQMAQKINDTSKKNLLQESTKKLVEKDLLTTERVFRTAYYLAMSDRPFTDHDKLIELQTLNSAYLGSI